MTAVTPDFFREDPRKFRNPLAVLKKVFKPYPPFVSRQAGIIRGENSSRAEREVLGKSEVWS